MRVAFGRRTRYTISIVKRLLAILGALLFVLGVLVVPALHRLDVDHCDSSGQTESHDPDSCSLCKIAATALVAPCVSADILLPVETISWLSLPPPRCSILFTPKSHLARAPPLLA